MVRMNQAVQTTVDWTLDPSKLLVGHRFASGAYSRLYRGLYDDKPVAIKFIRQPDDDDNGKMAAKLEKQYNSEINSLSHLYHKNVIKVTINMIMYNQPFVLSLDLNLLIRISASACVCVCVLVLLFILIMTILI